MIFGKKPEPRGTGDREGEEEFAKSANSRMQEMYHRYIKCQVYVLKRASAKAEDQTARETERTSACQGGSGLKSEDLGSFEMVV
jgi:hypothetical protein